LQGRTYFNQLKENKPHLAHKNRGKHLYKYKIHEITDIKNTMFNIKCSVQVTGHSGALPSGSENRSPVPAPNAVSAFLDEERNEVRPSL
jgi:hypothetical protein